MAAKRTQILIFKANFHKHLNYFDKLFIVPTMVENCWHNKKFIHMTHCHEILKF